MAHLILRDMDIPDLKKFDVYVANGGYEGLRKALTLKPDERTNPHGVPGHSHIVRDSLEPKDCTGFGQHGGLGANEQRPFLFVSGGGFVPGSHRSRSSLIDIAPTVLRHLGLYAAGMDGRPLPRYPVEAG